MIYAPLPARGGRKADEALGFGSLSFEDNRVQAGESRPRAFSLAERFVGGPLGKSQAGIERSIIRVTKHSGPKTQVIRTLRLAVRSTVSKTVPASRTGATHKALFLNPSRPVAQMVSSHAHESGHRKSDRAAIDTSIQAPGSRRGSRRQAIPGEPANDSSKADEGGRDVPAD